ncbi:MAG: TonB-dependent receptor domain-containing protein, partial [Ignavibacteriales bacterium]
INVPLVTDKLAVRFAGALTDRSGYDFNATTHHAVNGRDLWSGRISIGFNPTERVRTSLVWERFNEDDNRSRTGKQLCKRDPGPQKVGDTSLGWGPVSREINAGLFLSQGCLPVSLYDDSAFETPNGLSIPFIGGIVALGTNYAAGEYEGYTVLYPLGEPSPGDFWGAQTFINPVDPYGKMRQSRDLRTFNSLRDPVYRAKADVVQFNLDFSLTDSLTLTSQTTYDADSVYSFQDYNRFNTVPVFRDTSSLYTFYPWYHNGDPAAPSEWAGLAPGGYYCDPQIGCSNTIAGFDISKAKSTQWLQELRLQSDFAGPINFSAGMNYTQFKVLADYYVFFNLMSAYAQTMPFNGQADPSKCNLTAINIFPIFVDPVENGTAASFCPYIDPNPIESINGEGHNYFRSKNPYKLKSAAAFGELYWQINPATKLTMGLRYTDDHKTFTPVPSQLLLSPSILGGGDVSRGYPELPDIKQHWGEWTGRLGVDWKPDVSFTDETMLYAFYSRGYKGGGANPPPVGFTKRSVAEVLGFGADFPGWDRPMFTPIAQNTSPTFRPEFVNAFEVGAKNTLLQNALRLNGDVFFYDYKDYQVSKVVDRTVANENFDAHVWGLELEALFTPSKNLRLLANLGYLDTAIGSGARSIDVMNRTQGNPAWILSRPWVQFPSNCIVPVSVLEPYVAQYGVPEVSEVCGGTNFVTVGLGVPLIDPATGERYDPRNYPESNGGAGIAQNLKGNELPNSPHWTMNVGAQYSHDFDGGWKATVRADGYWQSQSWARVYNAVNDKLHGWYNANLSFWVENDDGLKIELYAKNILDKSPITDAFINSDDTALTTNVFTLDPRLIGLSIKKDF